MAIEFKLHDLSTAPEQSRPLLEKAREKYGMIPNLLRVMAEAPALLKAYLDLGGTIGESSLSPIEQQVVFQTANFENDCHYCVPAHTALSRQAGVDEPTIEALRSGTQIPDAKLEALRRFAGALVRSRGQVDQGQMQRLLDAGYAQRQALEVVAAVAFKVMSNYTNALADTPVDKPFQKFAWTKPEPATSAA
jgi:uncharacterized peroxidase-related enzyme